MKSVMYLFGVTILLGACADNHCTPAQAKEGFCGAATSDCPMKDRDEHGKCWPH